MAWIGGAAALSAVAGMAVVPGPGRRALAATARGEGKDNPLQTALDHVAPVAGHRSRIVLGDAIPRLIEAGILVSDKLAAAVARHKAPHEASVAELLAIGLPRRAAGPDQQLGAEMWRLLDWPSPEPMRVDRSNAGFYLMLLWPVGLANRLDANETSPVVGEYLERLASTSGWTLGSEANGAAYFNKHDLVELLPEQAELAVRVAKMVYRPCCDNSTFFQDCNHGSAMFGLLQLGAAQGLSEKELYEEALAFNAFWFPDNYAKTHLWFRLFKAVEWDQIDPEVVLSYPYSALSPWLANIEQPLSRVPDLLPLAAGSSSCSI